MSRFDRRRSALITTAVLFGTLLWMRQPAATAAPTAQITNLAVTANSVQFVLDVAGLPSGTAVAPSSVQVTADGVPLTPQASLLTQSASSSAPLPVREAMLVLDTSGSMQGSRIAAAKAAALAYARAVPADVKIGLVTFSDQPVLVVAPTVSRTTLAAGLDRVSAGGNTALYDAVLTAISAMPPKSANSERRLLILSDGEDNVSVTSLANAERTEQADGVGVDMVGIEVSPQQQAVMRQLTAYGNGAVLPASGLGELTSAFIRAAATFTRSISVSAPLPSSLAGHTVKLTASFTVAGQPLTVTSSVAVPAAQTTTPTASNAATTAHAATPAKARIPLVLVALCFAGLLGIGLLVLGTAKPKPASQARLNLLDDYSWAPQQPRAAGASQDGAVTSAALAVADRLLRSDRARARVVSSLERAGMRIRPQEWLLLRMSVVAAAIALCTMLSGSFPLSIVLGTVVGLLLTSLYVRIKADRRTRAFAEQLPDVLQMVASSLRSGFSLAQAFDGMVQEGSQPAAGEFGRALAESRLGIDLEDALDAVAARMDSRDLAWVVMAVRISRDVGGNLAEVLLTTVGTIRERATLKRQIRALSAEGRLSAYVLIALPILIGTFFAVFRPTYLRPLYTEAYGVIMLIVAVFGMLLGSWWMARVVKVEV